MRLKVLPSLSALDKVTSILELIIQGFVFVWGLTHDYISSRSGNITVTYVSTAKFSRGQFINILLRKLFSAYG